MAITAGFTGRKPVQPQNTRFNTKDLPEHGITIIGPADADYEGSVAKLISNLPDTTIETLKPYSVFVQNNSERSIVACLLKWEFVKPDGRVKTQASSYITLWKLMSKDAEGTGGMVIAPNSSWFFTPSGFSAGLGSQEVDLVQAQSDGVGANDSARVERERTKAQYLGRLNARLAGYSGITVSLDGVFFDDGTFVGPDSTNFYESVKARLRARRDVFEDVERGVQTGEPVGRVFNVLEAEEEKKEKPFAGLKANTMQPEQVYSESRRAVIRELLRMKDRAGDEDVLDLVRRPLGRPRVELKKR